MSTALSVAHYVVIELPGNVCQTALRFLRKWWYSHYH